MNEHDRAKAVLSSALAAPSSASSDATSGRPIAMGSIVNVYRGGLVAARIDDDLSKVAILLEVNIPEVVDPSESVPDELKSKKASAGDLGTSSFRHITFVGYNTNSEMESCQRSQLSCA